MRIRKRLYVPLIAVASVVAAVIPAVASSAPAQAGTSPGIAVAAMPAYAGYWDSQWSTLESSSGGLPMKVVVNDNNGDSVTDANWQGLIHDLHQKGIKVLGYVHTDYGTRSAAAVDTSIDNYFPSGTTPGDTAPDGILLDTFGTYDVNNNPDCTGTSYYNGIAGHAYSDLGALAGATVWANAGTAVRSCYLGLTNQIDTFVTFEGTESTYNSFTPYNVNTGSGFNDGSGTYPAWRFAHVVFDTPSADVHSVVDRAVNSFAGYVYTTDDSGANPYDTFPSNTYLNDLVSYAATK